MKFRDYHEIPRAVPVQPMKRPFPSICDLAGALPAVRASDEFAERLPHARFNWVMWRDFVAQRERALRLPDMRGGFPGKCALRKCDS